MQPRNLGWKFAFVGLLIGMSLYSVWAKGLRQGIDLKGGHILTFEVRSEGERDEDLVPKVISTLKRRIDPQGLYMLEWRPVGSNRLEVRMPLGSDEAQRAKQDYLRATDRIQTNNIQRSDVQQVAEGGPQRDAIIAEAEKLDPARAEALRKVAQRSDEVLRARQAVEQLQTVPSLTEQPLKEAEKAYDNARATYDEAVRDVFDINVNVEQLGQVLSLYVAEREKRFLPKSEVQSRRTAFDAQLKELCQKHPARASEITAAGAAYRAWSEKRTGLDDPADLKRLVASAGVLEFRIAPTLPVASGGELAMEETEYQTYMEQLAQQGPMAGRNRPERFQWFPVRGSAEERFATNLVIGMYAGRKYMLLYNEPGYMMIQEPGARRWKLTSAYPTRDDMGRPIVGFEFDARGAGQMGILTGAHKEHFMAILLDDEVYSAPVIKATIYDKGVIEGAFSTQQVGELVRTLEAGSLQGRVNENPVSEKTIAPGIGEDNRKAGLRAAFWGLFGTVAFMLIYYMLAGSIADAAMMMNLLLTLGAMSFVEAVFTLPGIAGLTLSTAMAVDANVLIYERLREEQAKSLSIRMAVRNAYTNAFSAILDSNVTTLITAVILGWVGTEEVKGFAITLGLGVAFNLFTAVSVTRWVFQWLMERGLLKERVRMLRLIGVPNVNWMAKRRIFWTISVVLAAAGIAALAVRGRDVLGIEFSSGTQAVFSFRSGSMIPGPGGQPVLPERGQVEQDLVNAARQVEDRLRGEADRLPGQLASAPEDAREALQKRLDEARFGLEQLPRFDPKVETLIDRAKADKFLGQFDTDRSRSISLTEWTDGGGNRTFFEQLDADRDGALTRAELDRMPERSYQVATKVADVDLLRQVVRSAFPEALDMRSSVKFDLKPSGTVERLKVELKPEDRGITHISTDLTARVDAAARARFVDFTAGVMFVLENIEPALTEQELSERIRTMRLQPDFADYQFNRTAVMGLEPVADGKSYRSLAVLVLNPNVDYVSRQDEWRNFAEQELRLVTAAMQREESLDSVSEFSPAVAGEASQRAVVACVLAWLAIVVYLWLRFGSVRWGLAAVICLVHDLIVVLGLVALSPYLAGNVVGKALGVTPLTIDMTVIAAFLTIIGASVNDTIVVFDRIRENRGKLTSVNENIINQSINQTLSRTLLTGVTTLIALLILYTMGGPGFHPFTYTLLCGFVIGTLSSIAVAAPLLLGFRKALVGKAIQAAAAPPPVQAVK